MRQFSAEHGRVQDEERGAAPPWVCVGFSAPEVLKSKPLS